VIICIDASIWFLFKRKFPKGKCVYLILYLFWKGLRYGKNDIFPLMPIPLPRLCSPWDTNGTMGKSDSLADLVKFRLLISTGCSSFR
jgi:hypothetical protein